MGRGVAGPEVGRRQDIEVHHGVALEGPAVEAPAAGMLCEAEVECVRYGVDASTPFSALFCQLLVTLMYFAVVMGDRCRQCSRMRASLIPASEHSVATPARKLWPLYSSASAKASAGSIPVASRCSCARRLTILAMASGAIETGRSRLLLLSRWNTRSPDLQPNLGPVADPLQRERHVGRRQDHVLGPLLRRLAAQS